MINKFKELFNNPTTKIVLFIIIIHSILVFFTICAPVPVHAASGQTYFPMQQNENGTIPSGVSDYITSNLVNGDTQYYFIYGPFTTWGDGSSAYYYLEFDKDNQ